MHKLLFPHVILPTEFISLLKSTHTVTSSMTSVLEILRKSDALNLSMEDAFKEFDGRRGLEKTMTALGWTHFRERLASMYIYKAIHGVYPKQTNLDLVEDIQKLETRFLNHTTQGVSRLFLLGFYIRLANIQVQKRENNKFLELTVPEDLEPILRLSHGRSEKIDWLIIIIMHFANALGTKITMNAISSGKKFDEIYELLAPETRKNLSNNLLAYGASIFENDVFLFDKV